MAQERGVVARERFVGGLGDRGHDAVDSRKMDAGLSSSRPAARKAESPERADERGNAGAANGDAAAHGKVSA